jgi:hypothetical protein
MPEGDESSSDQSQCSQEQNSSSASQDSSSSPTNYTPADGGQSSSQGDTPIGPPSPPAGSPAPPTDDGSANQCSPEQNYTPAGPDEQTSSQPGDPSSTPESSQADVCTDDSGGGSSGVVAASAAPLLIPPEPPPEPPPDLSTGQAANDNALSGEAANDNAIADEAVTEEEVGEGLETAEEIVETEEILDLIGAVLAPEVVIPLLIIGAAVVLLSSDNPTGADSASNQQPDEADDGIASTCTGPEASASSPSTSTYKPVIPGQKYSDQTCLDETREQLQEQLNKDKKACASRLPFKPPKRPFDESDPAQAAKKKLLCDDLRRREQAWQDLIKTRDQIQDECFNSPKTTQDEIERDEVHQQASTEAAQALENVRKDIAFYGCP